MSEMTRVEAGDAALGRWAGRLADGQHPVPLSVALHLLPGVLVAVAYFAAGVPVAGALGYPPLFGLLLAAAFVLVPSQLGFLLYLGWRRNGRPSLEGIVLYRDRTPARRFVVLCLLLFAWAWIAGAALSWADGLVFERLFSWVPERYLVGQGLGIQTAEYPRSAVLVTLLVGLVVSGVAAAAVEEYYFRGYLLPRISRLGAWAPVFNTVLFALYHLWTPWQAISRIASILPAAYVVQRTRNFRIYLWVHCALNTSGILLTLAAVLAGVAP